MEVKTIERWGADWEQVVIGRAADRREAPARRPAEPDDRDVRRRRRAAGDRVRRDEHRARPADPGRAARRRAARQPPDRARREDGRRSRTGCSARATSCNLTADGDGILILPADTPLGVPLADLYGDVVLDVDVKPNRGDALSILGLAREVAAATGQAVRWPEPVVEEGSGPSTAERLAVDVREPDLCTRFVGALGERRDGRAVAGPRPDAPARRGPAPDQQRRRRLELRDARAGQADPHVRRRRGPRRAPMAAPTIVVRRAAAGERLETLDHVDPRPCTDDMLVIADPEGAIGVAGRHGRRRRPRSSRRDHATSRSSRRSSTR